MHLISFKLSKQETDKLSAVLERLNFNKKKDDIWVLKIDKYTKAYLLNNKIPILFVKDDLMFPTVTAAKMFEDYYSVAIVDQGAKPHILNGADLMAPGIVSIRLQNHSDVVIIESEDKSILAIGRFIQDFLDALNKKHGKVAKNIHYLNDKLYKVLTLRRVV
ncbi:MAG: PUA domain-containing protein [Thermoprotei archaeon]